LDRRRKIETALERLAPGIPAYESGVVVDHALDSSGLRSATPEEAAWLSLTAYVRHTMTDYDELLEEGYDPVSARFFVREAMTVALAAWGVRRTLPHDEAGD
jgi:hypothetical protein